jgi:hypothetical protein
MNILFILFHALENPFSFEYGAIRGTVILWRFVRLAKEMMWNREPYLGVIRH